MISRLGDRKMKKIILILATVVYVAAAVQAQSPRVEVAITSAALNGNTGVTCRASTQTTRQLNLQKAVTRRVAQASVKAQQVKKDSPAKPVASKALAKQAEGSVKQWLKAIFLGGRFPNESSEAYHDRLVAQSQPASLPFK
ncbi:hypothetical protein IJ556_04395 [bacterium]|nr:hypothetical protein [bacterium]